MSLKLSWLAGDVVIIHSPCPETQRLGGPAGSPPPACGAGKSGPQCRTLVPGREPWEPCGPDRNWPTCQALWLCHLKVEHISATYQNIHGMSDTLWGRMYLEQNQRLFSLLFVYLLILFSHDFMCLNRTTATNTNIPLLTTGIFRGMLMMPTRSTVGTRERKMARIRSASPLPVLISCERNIQVRPGQRSLLLLSIFITSTQGCAWWKESRPNYVKT